MRPRLTDPTDQALLLFALAIIAGALLGSILRVALT